MSFPQRSHMTAITPKPSKNSIGKLTLARCFGAEQIDDLFVRYHNQM